MQVAVWVFCHKSSRTLTLTCALSADDFQIKHTNKVEISFDQITHFRQILGIPSRMKLKGRQLNNADFSLHL